MRNENALKYGVNSETWNQRTEKNAKQPHVFLCKNIELWQGHPKFLSLPILSQNMFLKYPYHSAKAAIFSNFLRKWLLQACHVVSMF